MTLRFLAVLALGVGALFAACGDGESGEGSTCEPGTEIFCKCRGGYEGTKTCLDDGETFGECATIDGPCPEIPDTTSSTSTGPDTTSSSSGSGGGSAGTKGLYELCASGGECASGECDGGFCTVTCASYEECSTEQVYGDCVRFAGGTKQLCAPYCIDQSECAAFGAASSCGGATALDDPELAFAVCGPWGDEQRGMPYGTLCDEAEGTLIYIDQVIEADCALGGTGLENVCVFGECSPACYADTDCPAADCTSNGEVVGCCESSASCN